MKSTCLVIPLLFAAAILTAPSCAGQNAPPPPAPPGLEVQHDVEMGTGGGRPLLAEIICSATPSTTPRPAVLCIHGGGWSSGTQKEAGWLARGAMLARHGYFVAVIEYRLAKEAKWPAQIEDCKLAVRWLRANAAKYNVDPNHIGCWGGSAGGHLVACLGTMGDVARYEGDGGYSGVSSKVQAVVDYSGPVDFRDGTFGNGSPAVSDQQKKGDAGMAQNFLGKSFQADPALWRDASPISYVQPGDPPFLLVYGDKDAVVSLAQATTFADALKKAGVPVEAIVDKNAGHVMGNVPGGPLPEINMQTLDADVVSFFDKYLKD